MDKAFKGRAAHKLLDPTQVANVDKSAGGLVSAGFHELIWNYPLVECISYPQWNIPMTVCYWTKLT